MFSHYITHVNGNRTRNQPEAPNLRLGRVNPIYSLIHIYLVDSPRIELSSAGLQPAAMTTLAHCPFDYLLELAHRFFRWPDFEPVTDLHVPLFIRSQIVNKKTRCRPKTASGFYTPISLERLHVP